MEIFPSFDEFKNLSQGKSRVLVYKILPAAESIFNIFLKFDQKEKCALLESLKGSSKIAGYSIIGVEPFLIFRR